MKTALLKSDCNRDLSMPPTGQNVDVAPIVVSIPL